MKRKQRRHWLIALILIVIVGLPGWKFWPQDRLLLHIATPVMSTVDFRPRMAQFDDLTPYFWLSDHELGYFVNDASDAHRIFMVRDLTTGATQRRFTASNQQIPFGEVGRLSPDGKWLLWMHHNRSGNGLPKIYAVDGSRVVSFPATQAYELYWMPDSQGVASTVWGNSVEIHRLADSSVHTIALAGAQQAQLLGFTPQGHAIVTRDGVMFGGAIFIKPPAGATLPGLPVINYPIMHLSEYALEAPSQPLRTFALHVPADADYGSLFLSPQGDRLLWSLYLRQASPLQEWLRHLFPGYKPPQHLMISWRVSRLDGSEMHEIGHATLQRNNGFYGNPRWVPDGKHISFIRHNTLYTIPAD